ncbi:MAG: hypothetical protein KAR16_06615 [Bacteroidales bacterium]|nr:hypothetical protein [Bacteroidales bacterium]
METIKEIRKLLNRFYQGETTLEEEKRLQEYFSSTTVPEEFIPDRDLFRSMKSGNEAIHVPVDLNQKILAGIDREERKMTRTRRISVFSLSGLAAGLLVVIALYTGYFRNDNSPRLAMTDTFENPQDAYEEARRTLAFVSAKLNTGTGELQHVQQVSKIASDPLKSLSKINKGSRELSLLGQIQRINDIEQ